MLSHIYTKLKNLWKKFDDKDYRRAFVASNISTTIAAQIETMRIDRGWTQTRLAKISGMKQSRISALEDPSNGLPTITTLLKIANAYDVGLIVQFVPFSRIAGWATGSSGDTFSVPSFREDLIGLPSPSIYVGTSSSCMPIIKICAASQPLTSYATKMESNQGQIYAH